MPLREHSPVRYFSSFYGQWDGEPHPEQIGIDNLLRMLEIELGGGVLELSCHPGHTGNDFTSPYDGERELEVRTLSDPRLRRIFPCARREADRLSRRVRRGSRVVRQRLEVALDLLPGRPEPLGADLPIRREIVQQEVRVLRQAREVGGSLEVGRREDAVAQAIVEEVCGETIELSRDRIVERQVEPLGDPLELGLRMAREQIVVDDDERPGLELVEKRHHMHEPQALRLRRRDFLSAEQRCRDAARVANRDHVSVVGAALAQRRPPKRQQPDRARILKAPQRTLSRSCLSDSVPP